MTNERIREVKKIYLTDPEYFKLKLGKLISRRNVDMVSKSFEASASVTALAEINHLSISRVSQVIASACYKIERIAKNMKTEKDNDPEGRSRILTQEEFDKIKELLYKGEPRPDIVNEVKRSKDVINYVAKAENLKNYFQLRRTSWEKYHYPGKGNISTTPIKNTPDTIEPVAEEPFEKFTREITTGAEQYYQDRKKEESLENPTVEDVLRQIESLKDRFPKYMITFRMILKEESMML